jgi:hypothetical protein
MQGVARKGVRTASQRLIASNQRGEQPNLRQHRSPPTTFRSASPRARRRVQHVNEGGVRSRTHSRRRQIYERWFDDYFTIMLTCKDKGKRRRFASVGLQEFASSTRCLRQGPFPISVRKQYEAHPWSVQASRQDWPSRARTKRTALARSSSSRPAAGNAWRGKDATRSSVSLRSP